MFKKMLITLVAVGMIFGMSSNVFADTSADANANTSVGVDNSDRSAATVTIDDHSSSKSKVYNRQIVNPGNTPIPGTNGFFTAPTPDSSFRQARELIFYLTGDVTATYVNLTEGACEALAKGGDVDTVVQVVRERLAVAKADQDGTKWITISVIKPVVQDGKLIRVEKADLRVAGFVSSEADDGDTTSFQVIGKAALKVIAAGLDHLQITAEGAHRKVEASGWGIGFYTVGGTVSDGGTTSGLVGGGTGYSQNETGPEDRPWIQGNAGLGLIRAFDRAPVDYAAPVTK
jgi:hypothetical protein